MMLRAEWARERWHWPLAAVSLVAACSFQDFEYLQVPADSPAQGGSAGDEDTGGSSGNSGTSGNGGQGGNQPTGGQGGTGNTSGGGGSTATGGVSGSSTGGTGDPGGAGGVGGEDTGTGGTGNTGATGELVNPSFESFSTTGWTVDPASALAKRYVYVQAPTGAVPAPDGAYELAVWHQTEGYSFEIYQAVTGLADGTYTFQGSFSRGEGFNEAYMFARNCGGDDSELPIPPTDASAFTVFAITGIEVSGGSCEVGIAIDGNAVNWLNADKFSLEPE
jgi:hypothetical protein